MITFGNNVKWVVAVVSLVSAFGSAWYIRGTIAENQILKIREAYSQAIDKQNEVIRKLEKKTQDIANEAERKGRAEQQKHNKELAYYRDLVRERGGLYDNGSTTSGGTNTGSAGSDQGTSSGTRLSNELTEFLITQANKADQVVSQYLTCQKYVLDLTELLKGETK